MLDLDEIDLKLVHALQIDGRESFRGIADALGVSERMISRRYARLRSRLMLRVVGTTDAHRLDQLDWFVRIRTTNHTANQVAAALAAHKDTSWVNTLSGTPAVTCILRTASSAGGEIAPVLTQLGQSIHVREVTAQCLLAPVAGVGGWPGRISSLTPAEELALSHNLEEGSPSGRRITLSDVDSLLISALAEDGRSSISRLSLTTNVPESTVRRRIADLTAERILRFEVDIDARLYGRSLEAICWIEMEPHGIGDVSKALATHPQVAFASTATGMSAVIAILELAGPRELHDYLSQSLGALPAIRHVETAIVDRRLKRAGAVLAGI